MQLSRNIFMTLCVFWLLLSCGADKGERLRQLEMLEQMNRADSVMRNDSLAEDLVAYFDKHGSPNERMRARYMLGRTYFDLGELPRAISSYQDAIDVADTTVADFDFYTLSCIFSQMATIYRRQLLLTNEIEARKKASHYDFRAKQIKWAIYNQAMSSGAYILLNKKDSAEIILKSALEQYRKNGYTQEVLRYSKTLIYLYTDNPQRLTEAKALMDEFEANSDLFDEHHELPPSQRQYYDYKGKYFESVHQLDSAEYYYRKIYRPGMSYVSKNPMYRGLLSVFSKRHQADSIAKYAQLYCMANDSSIALKDQNIIAQMTANYNYNRLQKKAHENEIKAYKTLIGLIITIVLWSIFCIVAFLIWKSNQQKIKRLKTEFAEATDEYEGNIHELQLLESSRQQVIACIQKELTEAQSENNDYRKMYAKAQQTISQINQDYESKRSRLLEDNETLQKRIDELQKNDIISKYLADSDSFVKETIVKRICEIADCPLTSVTETEWNELTKAFGKTFPTLFHNLSLQFNMPQYIRVCILTILGIGSSSQANMLGTTTQRISNIKFTLNKNLFNEASSRTLHKNLAIHYNFYSFKKYKTPKKDKKWTLMYFGNVLLKYWYILCFPQSINCY